MRFLSTHPAAILVLLSSYGRGLENVDLNLTQELAQRIMHASPVAYVRDAKLRRSLFEVERTSMSTSTPRRGTEAETETGLFAVPTLILGRSRRVYGSLGRDEGEESRVAFGRVARRTRVSCECQGRTDGCEGMKISARRNLFIGAFVCSFSRPIGNYGSIR
jgi:hypothetical protein